MTKFIKAMVVLVCVMCCVGLLAGCGDEASSSATAKATPAPTGTQNTSGGQSNTADPGEEDRLIRPKDESLQNAIKEGETYRYLIYMTSDPENPFNWMPVNDQGEAAQKRAEYEAMYGITIEYVKSPGDWVSETLAAAYSGTPITDIYHCGGPFTIPMIYNHQNLAGALLAPLSDYTEYSNFTDSEYFNVNAQNGACIFNDKLYFAVPAEAGLGSVATNMFTFFNKDLVRDMAGYSSADIYKMYQEGNWTWDKFEEIAIACTDPDKDIYGTTLGQNNALMWNLMPSNNSYILSQIEDENTGKKYYGFTGDSANALEAWDFLINLAKKGAVLMDYQSEEVVAFGNGAVALMTTYANRSDSLVSNGSTVDFGLILPPKGPKADNYVSSANWFTPLCVFKDVPNAAGAVQVLSEYIAPGNGMSSEINVVKLEADALTRGYAKDEESLQTLKDSIPVSIVEPFMAYWSNPSFETSAGQNSLCHLYYNTQSFVDGSTTPATYYASVKSALNNALKAAQGL